LNTDNKFKLLANCNLVVSLMQAFNFSEGLVRGRDLVEGKPKSILSLMWLLMREYYLRKHDIQSEEEFQAIANQYLEVVLNQTQSMILSVAAEAEDIESLRIILYYGEEGEIFMTFHDESELMCPLLPDNFEDLQRESLQHSLQQSILSTPLKKPIYSKSKRKTPEGNESHDEASAKIERYVPAAQRRLEILSKVKHTTRDATPISLVTDISPLFSDMSAKQSPVCPPAMTALRPTHHSDQLRPKKANKSRACLEEIPAPPDQINLPEPIANHKCTQSTKQDSLKPRSAVIATNYNSSDKNRSSHLRRIHIPITISFCPDDIYDAALTENFDMYSNRKKIMVDASCEKPHLPGGFQLFYKSAALHQRDKLNDATKAYRSEQVADEKENYPFNTNFQTPQTSRFEPLADFTKQKSDITYRSRHNIPRSALKSEAQESAFRLAQANKLEPTLTSYIVVPHLREAEPHKLAEGLKKENLTNRKSQSSKPLYPAASQLGISLTTEAQLKLAKLNKSFLENLGITPTSYSSEVSRLAVASATRDQLDALDRIKRASRLEAILFELPECQTKRSLTEIFNKLADFEKIPSDFMRQTFRSLNTSHLSAPHQRLVRDFETLFFSSQADKAESREPPAFLTAKMSNPFMPKKLSDESEGLPPKWNRLDDRDKKRFYREQVRQRILSSSEQVEKPSDPKTSLAALVCEQLAPHKNSAPPK
jgi:hypothetical protein